MIHTTKDSMWTDEAGVQIPVSRITKLERLMENKSSAIVKKATSLNKQLSEFKLELRKVCNEIYAAAMAEKGAKTDAKGNYTWFNFDRSIKIEVAINERIDFDDLTIKASKEKFDKFLSENIQGKAEFAKELVTDAFTTSRGKLDTKKVMGLLKYRSKIQDETFQDAMTLLEQSIRRPDSKTYFRVWVKDGNGKYQNIDLNFSSID
ncbi:MAG: DUF3164 family protein [Bacteroidetes bacterium]|nr:DUF3164 family protein [Bacteroidota bacterium]